MLLDNVCSAVRCQAQPPQRCCLTVRFRLRSFCRWQHRHIRRAPPQAVAVLPGCLIINAPHTLCKPWPAAEATAPFLVADLWPGHGMAQQAGTMYWNGCGAKILPSCAAGNTLAPPEPSPPPATWIMPTVSLRAIRNIAQFGGVPGDMGDERRRWLQKPSMLSDQVERSGRVI